MRTVVLSWSAVATALSLRLASLLSSAELQELGYKVVVYPLSALFSATKAVEETYRALYEENTTAARQGAMVSLGQFEEIIGVPGWQELEQQYVVE
ncbi:MAG: hypothetical protein IID48_15675 [Proteobacteria bacterium]|nr:hypothetical protein [Pseudomonadota bacterium]